jgi:methionyl-tRNA formyltransferase
LALRLVFMGTPDFAVPTLLRIIKSNHRIVAVYTQAPKPAGRGLAPKPSAVSCEAVRFGLPVFTPNTLNEINTSDVLRAHRADAAVVVAYGLILPKVILESFPLGCFNVHASLLPRWRGAAPIQRAIMAGDRETGVTVMRMDEGLDTGPIAALRDGTVPLPIAGRSIIKPNETAGELHDELAELGARLMLVALDALDDRSLIFTPQPTLGATYANKIKKSETRINWKKPCREVHNHCRGLSPIPGAWFEFSSIGRVKVLRTAIGVGDGPPGYVLDNKPTIACSDGALRLVELQRSGGKPMSADAFWRGLAVAPGSTLR